MDKSVPWTNYDNIIYYLNTSYQQGILEPPNIASNNSSASPDDSNVLNFLQMQPTNAEFWSGTREFLGEARSSYLQESGLNPLPKMPFASSAGSCVPATSQLPRYPSNASSILQENLFAEPEEYEATNTTMQMSYDTRYRFSTGDQYNTIVPDPLQPTNNYSQGSRSMSDGALLVHGVDGTSRCTCGKPFNGKYARGNLLRHVKYMNTPKGIFCRCGTFCTRTDNTHKHCAKCHPTLPCCECGKLFVLDDNGNVVKGRYTKKPLPDQCKKCGKYFSTRDQVQKHMSQRHSSTEYSTEA